MNITLFLASKSDVDYGDIIQSVLDEFGLKADVVTYSAHKVPEKVLEVVNRLNENTEPTVVISCVGMSNGLSGVLAGSCIHPIIACPVVKDSAEYLVDIHSTVRMPSDVPSMTVLHPKNAALAAVRILAESDASLKEKMKERIAAVKARYN